jgi:2-polyprenyl-3-methyl-5-hydroxy-6-metoxy-1,4-benzoquinol methylase
MDTQRIEHIRQEEREYHEDCFENYKLYEKGSWLDKPIPLVMELAEQLDSNRPLTVLDLGCGAGRNSIPLAQLVKPAGGTVLCVDLLDKALEKVQEYSEEFEVEDVIETQQADIGEYKIAKNAFDYIVAASCLEHVKTPGVLEKVLDSLAKGTKSGGIIFIMMNTNIEEVDKASGKKRETLIEVIIPKERALELFRAHYEGWEELHLSDEPMELEITRDDIPVLLKADSLTVAYRKPS